MNRWLSDLSNQIHNTRHINEILKTLDIDRIKHYYTTACNKVVNVRMTKNSHFNNGGPTTRYCSSRQSNELNLMKIREVTLFSLFRVRFRGFCKCNAI